MCLDVVLNDAGHILYFDSMLSHVSGGSLVAGVQFYILVHIFNEQYQ